MRSICRGKSVVELGALLGFSTVLLAEVASRLTSIDRHDHYSGPTLKQFISNLHRYGVNEKVKVIKGDALQVLSSPASEVDVAFIDLTGDFQLTKDVLLQLGNSSVAPIALVHDFDRPYCDVSRAIRAAGWRIVGQVDTLVLCEKDR